MVNFSNLDDVAKKLKELREAISVCNKVEDQVSWAVDFTSFNTISEALDPLYEAVGESKSALQQEVDYIEDQLHEYKYKLGLFNNENKIHLNE
jgi:hypothetical protein